MVRPTRLPTEEGEMMARVLVACEYSGTVRDAFTRAGHDAMSCDTLPSDTPGDHYMGDVRDLITEPCENCE